MYLMTRSKSSTGRYLTKAEKQFIRENDLSYQKYLENSNQKDNSRAFANYLNQESNHEKAQFTGELAKTLKLDYQKNGEEMFLALREGKNPFSKEEWKELNTGVEYRKNGRFTNKSENQNFGESMVLAMPKSLSLYYSLQEPEKQAEIREAINSANAKVIKEMSKCILPADSKYVLDWQVKENPEKYKDIEPKYIIDSSKTETLQAEFFHYEQRGLQVHLHKHIEIIPVAKFYTMDGQEKIMGVSNNELYNQQKEMTSNFNTLLVSELENKNIACLNDRENGLEFTFRVAGIERATELEASSRRNEIQEIKDKKLFSKDGFIPSSLRHEIAEYGRELQYSTREKKENMTYEGIHSLIEEKTFNQLGIEGVANLEKEQLKANYSKEVIAEDKTFSIKNSQYFQTDGEMSKNNLKAEISNNLRWGEKRYTDIGDLKRDVDKEFERLVNSREVILKENGNYTTLEVINNEMTASVEATKLYTKTYDREQSKELQKYFEAYQEKLPEGRKLFEGQKQACQAITNDYSLICVEGYAGSAKTTSVLTYATKLYQSKEYQDKANKGQPLRIIGCCTQQLTANNLGKECGINEIMNAEQLCRKFYDFENNKWREDKLASFANTRLLIDEAGQVEAKHYSKIMELANKVDNFQVLLVGHSSQLQSVGAGNVYSHLVKNIPKKNIATLDTVVRQKTKESHLIAMSFLDKKVELAVDTMKDMGWWNEVDSKEQALKQIAKDYINDPHEKKMCIAHSNEDVNALNDYVREAIITKQIEDKKEALSKGLEYDSSKDIDYKNQVSINVFLKNKSKTTKEYQERNFAVNDKIVLTEAIQLAEKTANGKYRPLVRNGEFQKLPSSTRATIVGIEPDGRTKDGEENYCLTVNVEGKEHKLYTKLNENRTFNLGLASTTALSQGQTCEVSYILGDRMPANNAYVNFSRMEYETRCYIEKDKVQGFIESAKQDNVKASTLEDINCMEAWNQSQNTKETIYEKELEATCERLNNLNEQHKEFVNELPHEIKHRLSNDLQLDGQEIIYSQELEQEEVLEDTQSLELTGRSEELPVNNELEEVEELVNETPQLEQQLQPELEQEQQPEQQQEKQPEPELVKEELQKSLEEAKERLIEIGLELEDIQNNTVMFELNEQGINDFNQKLSELVHEETLVNREISKTVEAIKEQENIISNNLENTNNVSRETILENPNYKEPTLEDSMLMVEKMLQERNLEVEDKPTLEVEEENINDKSLLYSIDDIKIKILKNEPLNDIQPEQVKQAFQSIDMPNMATLVRENPELYKEHFNSMTDTQKKVLENLYVDNRKVNDIEKKLEFMSENDMLTNDNIRRLAKTDQVKRENMPTVEKLTSQEVVKEFEKEITTRELYKAITPSRTQESELTLTRK